MDAEQNPPGADDTSSSATTPEGQKHGMANRKVMATTHSLDGNGTPSIEEDQKDVVEPHREARQGRHRTSEEFRRQQGR